MANMGVSQTQSWPCINNVTNCFDLIVLMLRVNYNIYEKRLTYGCQEYCC